MNVASCLRNVKCHSLLIAHHLSQVDERLAPLLVCMHGQVKHGFSLFSHSHFQLVGRKRFTKIMTLCEIAIQFQQKLHLLAMLYAIDCRLDIHGSCDRQKRFDRHLLSRICRRLLDQGGIYFQLIQRHARDNRDRAGASPKVVQTYLDAKLLQLGKHHHPLPMRLCLFRNFQFQIAGRQLTIAENRLDGVRQSDRLKSMRGQINRYDQRPKTGINPLLALLARCPQDPFFQQMHHSAPFGKPKQCFRRQKSPLWVVPLDKRLHPPHSSRSQIEKRLVMERELAVHNRLIQVFITLLLLILVHCLNTNHFPPIG